MREGDASLSTSFDEALALLISIDESVGGLPSADLDRFFAERPQIAPRLRAAFADWRRVQARPAGPASATWQRVIERLAAHAPPQQRYEQRGLLGRGGMGEVCEVWDEDLRRRLAMKTIRTDLGGKRDRLLARFLEEAQITAQLDHPGIVPVHELGLASDGRVFFTMKLVKGHDLAQVLDKVRAGQDGWSQTRVLGVLLKVCEAMAFAHSRQVIHRDLKPGNIMVGRFGEVYVMDWGLARVLGKPDGKDIRPRAGLVTTEVRSDRHDQRNGNDSPLVTIDGDVLGTPAYMAPEQASGDVENVGPAADVYSIGAILYELLAGTAPHQQPGEVISPQAMLLRVQVQEPQTLALRAPKSAPELVAICERAMARAPAARYDGMAALVDDLRAYLENRVVRAYAVGPWMELRKWVARHRGMARALAALMVVTVTAAFAVAWLQTRRAEEERLTALTQRAEDLLHRFEHLGPIHPDAVPTMQRWLDDASALIGATGSCRAELLQLTQRGRAAPPAALLTPEVHELRYLRERLGLWDDFLADARVPDDAAARQYAANKRAALTAELPDLRARIAELELSIVQPLRFAAESDQLRWSRLATIVRALDLLRPPPTVRDLAGRGLLARVETDLSTARSLVRVSIDEHATAWRDASERVARHPAYGGLTLRPQLGLVPIGPDPESGLEEFGHIISGERPLRRADGSLCIGPDTGIVLVLLPGGEFGLSAQKDDSAAANYDPDLDKGEGPVRRVPLAPFFIAKYETTQGQWIRATGRNPSARYAGANYINPYLVVTRTHPVEHVTWFAAASFCTRLGLTLPTEAQAEYGIRGGTTTVYWCGDTPDLILAENAGLLHRPADQGTANGYGLRGVMGNVAEWCRDPFVANFASPNVRFASGDAAVEALAAHERVWRDAGVRWSPRDVRSARRLPADPNDARLDLGVRASRPLDQ